MKAEEIERILIIGAGTMGRQIALHFALHGCEAVIYDIEAPILEEAMASIEKMAASYARHGQITPQEAGAAVGRISRTTVPAEAAANIDLISESVPEDPVLKGEVFARFHKLCPSRTLFTTNTSTLLPSMFAEAAGRPEKLLALHFHDLRLNRVVDVMPHPGTDPEAVEAVRGFAERVGLIPILLKRESHGYVFNYMLMALFQTAQTLAARDVASPEDVDRSWMGVTHMPVGPFGMMDSIGLDTVWKVTDYWAKRGQDPQSIQNADFLKGYVERGDLGQKTGAGFYRYPGPRFTQPGFVAGRKDKKDS